MFAIAKWVEHGGYDKGPYVGGSYVIHRAVSVE